MADSLGKILLITGGIIAAAGLLLLCLGRFGPGRLPGDILIQKENFSFYVPITTMLLVSIVLTILFNLIGRFR